MSKTLVTIQQRNRARALRVSMPGSEKQLWAKLKAHRMCEVHFRRQAPIGPYIADFVSHADRLIVEVDGDHHGFDKQARHDFKRDQFLAERGYRILRFTNGVVLNEMESVLLTIEAAVQRRLPADRYSDGSRVSESAPSQPSPARGEGYGGSP